MHNFALFLGPQMWIMRGSCVQSAITVRHFVSRKSTYSKWDLASDVVGFHHVLNSAKKSEFMASIKRSLQKKISVETQGKSIVHSFLFPLFPILVHSGCFLCTSWVPKLSKKQLIMAEMRGILVIEFRWKFLADFFEKVFVNVQWSRKHICDPNSQTMD